MRRRGTSPQYELPLSLGTDRGVMPMPRIHKHQLSEVPQEWRDHADQPWRVLFPDLDWEPPKRDL
jgi:hypothetical protein